MTAISSFAHFVCDTPRQLPDKAVAISRAALIDTVACIYAGSDKPVTNAALRAFSTWGAGEALVVGRQTKLIPPFAALVNAAAGHALDYDDYDGPGNAHPSAVIFPAVLAMAATREVSGLDILDAHIVGVEILQRLGEAMNMAHYRRGWHTTVTLGSIAAAGACARLANYDFDTTVVALSLGASMASSLTNQGGFTAKQLHAGFAAKNAVMAASFADAGITASDAVIDGPISLAKAMGEYDAEKFEAALSKLGNPLSIIENGLIQKPYPSCGYTHRLIDATLEIIERDSPVLNDITAVHLSVPDFYLDLLTYPNPQTVLEAMFSAEFNVAATLCKGNFGLSCLTDSTLKDPTVQRLRACSTLVGRTPNNRNLTYEATDPDVVEVTLRNGTKLRSAVGTPTGAPNRPMSDAARRAKFDECVQEQLDLDASEALWSLLSRIETEPSASAVLSHLG